MRLPALLVVAMLLPEAAQASVCSIKFHLDDAATFGALQLSVDYSAAGGDMNGAGSAVSCTDLPVGNIFARNDDDGAKVVGLGFSNLTGTTGPVDLAVCQYGGPSDPVASDFSLTVVDSYIASLGFSGTHVCGAPFTGQSPPYARDASLCLHEAVGQSTGSLCECDIDSSGGVSASDVLTILKKAVGQSVTLSCPACGGPPTFAGAGPGSALNVSVSVDCTLCGNGTVDPGEQCDPGTPDSGDCCKADCTYVSAGTPCDSGDYCAGDVCNNTGTCIPGSDPSPCDDGSPCTVDTCGATCSHTPGSSCEGGAHSTLALTLSDDPAMNSIKWKLSGGPQIDQADIGDPVGSAAYTLCVFDTSAGAPALAAQLTFGPGNEWHVNDPKGAVFKGDGTDDGVVKASIRTGDPGKSKISFSAKGANVPMPDPFASFAIFEMAPEVFVQLYNDDSLQCWEASWETARTNNGGKFKAVFP